MSWGPGHLVRGRREEGLGKEGLGAWTPVLREVGTKGWDCDYWFEGGEVWRPRLLGGRVEEAGGWTPRGPPPKEGKKGLSVSVCEDIAIRQLEIQDPRRWVGDRGPGTRGREGS